MQMKNKDVRRVMRKVTREIRNLNEDIKNDPMWKGRFYADSISVNYERYEDKSGVICYYDIALVDKQTGKAALYRTNTASLNFFAGKLWWAMNDFIVERIKVWDEKPTRETTKDYTKVKKLDKKFKVDDFNFYEIMR